MPAGKENKMRREKMRIDCAECKKQADCCSTGAWLDLEEAKRIVSLGLKGEFFQLGRDKDFPSGYRIGTSFNYNPCSFLDRDGLCSIHKVDYNLKPKSCREFPYENNRISPVAGELCTLLKPKIKKTSKRKK